MADGLNVQQFAAVTSPALTSLVDDIEPTEDDLTLMKRALGAAAARPDLIPTTFLSYLADYLQAGDFSITTNQISDFARFAANFSYVDANESTSSNYPSYVDLATVGPQVTGLADGNYVLIWGATCGNESGSNYSVGPSINGAAPPDALVGDQIQNVPTATARVYKLSNNGNNSIKLKYASSSSNVSHFGQRFLVALRYANL